MAALISAGMLLDIYPSPAFDDRPYRLDGYSVLGSEGRQALPAHIRGVFSSDCADLIGRQFGFVVSNPVAMPSFRMAVDNIVSSGTKKQVLRVYATGRVTSVADKHSIRNLSDEIHKGKPVRFEIPRLFIPMHPKLPIPTSEATTGPEPALIFWLRKICPFGESDDHPISDKGWRKLGLRHCLISLSDRVVRRAGGAPTLPGFSLRQLYQRGGFYAARS